MHMIKGKHKYIFITLLFISHLQIFSQETPINSTFPRESQYKFIQDTTQEKRLTTFNDLIVFKADSGDYETVDFLLQNGINPNSSTYGGFTALMYASQNGFYNIAKLLIDYGADVNIQPYNGNTALFAAVRSNDDSIAELLLESGANVDQVNSNTLTPLHYAAGYGYQYLVDLLIYYGASIDTLDDFGNSPLMVSIYSGAIYTSEKLINAGADVNKTDIYGNTPIMVAAQFNDTTLIKLLYHAGADLNKVNNRKSNALSFAVQNNSYDACKLLLDLGFNTNNEIIDKSYYQQSIENSNKEISTLLKERNLKTKLKPYIGGIDFYSGFSFSNNDFMFDFGGGIYEPTTKMMVNIGYKVRPYPSHIVEYRNNSFYQFWEKRHSLYLSFQHFYSLKKGTHFNNFGFVFGLNGELTWRYLSGSNNDKTTALIVPNFGLYYRKGICTIVSKWEIANYKSQGIGFNRFGMQLFLSIPTSKNRIINKTIKWLD